MTLEQYENITGLSVSEANEDRVNASIERGQRILEDLLGFTLDTDLVNDNFYTETGKTTSECPCPLTSSQLENLNDPDDVVTAYRVYDYNKSDRYLMIDPCTAINAVKLVNGSVTYKTLAVEEYRVNHGRDGLITSVEQNHCYCSCINTCSCVQLAVDADWVWESWEEIPNEIKHVWADIATYYSDDKNNIKSETLGSHSYTKFDKENPAIDRHNLSIIKRYAGPWGSATRPAIT